MLGNRALLSAALLGRVGDPLAVAGPVPTLFSDLGWTGKPTDTIYPNRIFEPRVADPLNVELVLPFAPGGARRSATTIGDLVLINADGELDDLREAAVDGRPVEVWQVRPGADFSTADLIFRGTAAGWREADDARMALGLRGVAWRLDVPVTRPTYTGAGGVEGGADIKGKFKPVALGRVLNVQPLLVDALNQIYQCHYRAMQSIDGVYDGGVAYTPAGDVADITAAVVSPGQFKTQLSGGYIKLGTAPTKTLTLDAHGDAPGGLYVERAADLAFRLLHDLQGLDDGSFEPSTFDDLKLAAPGAIGLYVGGEAITASGLMDAIMAGINGWWAENRFGRIEVGLVALPLAMPRATLRTKDIFDIERLSLPDAMDPPLWRVRVGYGRNWSPMDITQIGSSIVSGNPTRYAFLTEEFRFVTVEDVTIKTGRNIRAQEFTLFSAYESEADAQALADALFELYSVQRRLVRVRTKRQGLKLPLGGTIAIDYPRYGLSGGTNVVLVGKSVVAATQDCVLTVFW
jgi:hypothetical protein